MEAEYVFIFSIIDNMVSEEDSNSCVEMRKDKLFKKTNENVVKIVTPSNTHLT